MILAWVHLRVKARILKSIPLHSGGGYNLGLLNLRRLGWDRWIIITRLLPRTGLRWRLSNLDRRG